MENKELLYELELKVNELRETQLRKIKYYDISVKELLDLGFNNIFIKLDGKWFNLGYKEFDKDFETGVKTYNYYSEDFELNEEQLNVKVHYYNGELNDYNYLDVSVVLVNEEDKKLFIKE